MMEKSCRHVGYIFFCAVYVLTARTINAEIKDLAGYEACKESYNFESFRAAAFNRNPIIAEIDRDFAEELAIAFETEVMANPELQVEHLGTKMNLGGDNDSQVMASIGQAIRISDFGSRGRVSNLIRKTGSAEKRAKLLEFSQKLNLQFYTLYMLQSTHRIISDAELKTTEKVSQIRNAVKKGLLSDGDEMLFQGEKYRLQAQLKGISSNISLMQQELAKSTGIACLIATSGESKLTDIPSKKTLLEMAEKSTLSEKSRVDILANLAKEQTRLAELDSYPELTPSFVYQHTNDGGDFIGAAISMPIPFWNKNQGEKLRARAEEKAIGLRSAFLNDGGVELQITSLRNAAIKSKEQAELYSSKVIPSFEAALSAQEKLYEKGKGNVLQVWQTLRTLSETKTQSVILWLEAESTKTQLSLLVGEEL